MRNFRDRIGGCFDGDGQFAPHDNDQSRAQNLKREIAEAGVTEVEIIELITGYAYRQNIIINRFDEVKKAIEFFTAEE